MRLHRQALTQRSDYTENHRELLHTEALQKMLQTDAVTHRSLHTESFNTQRVYTQKLLRTDVVAQRSLYTESFHTQARLHTEAFTRSSFYTENSLNGEDFTHKRVYVYAQKFFPRASAKGSS